MALDPGPDQTGWCVYENGRVLASGISPNSAILDDLKYARQTADLLALEMIASYGMPVGASVFETCVWIGRFMQEWYQHPGARAKLCYRKDVKLHLCGSGRAKDGNVRQALLDLVGPAGLKASPGPTYGVKSHAWAALAVAVYAHDLLEMQAEDVPI